MENKLTTQSNRFDECVAELSDDAQEFFGYAVDLLSKSMVNGGGKMSAKSLLYAIAQESQKYHKESNTMTEQRFTLTAMNDRKTISEIYFTRAAAEIAEKIYIELGYTVTIEEGAK